MAMAGTDAGRSTRDLLRDVLAGRSSAAFKTPVGAIVVDDQLNL
jgi:hypothetical protein